MLPPDKSSECFNWSAGTSAKQIQCNTAAAHLEEVNEPPLHHFQLFSTAQDFASADSTGGDHSAISFLAHSALSK